MAANMMYTAIAGLNTFNEALSVVSDNIANANTTGFKSSTVDFGDLVSGIIPTANSSNITAQGVGSSIIGVSSNLTTGSEIQTGTWSDCMIQGSGYFQVENPTTGSVYYTRDGSFQVNSSGILTDTNGNEVLDNSGSPGAPITVEPTPSSPTYSSYAIDEKGDVIGTNSSGPVTVGTIGVTTFPNPNGLIRDGDNYYTPGTSAGAGVVGTAGTGQAGLITSGAIEGSNVDLTEQMVNLIAYQADYQANSKSITTDDNLLQAVVNLIR